MFLNNRNTKESLIIHYKMQLREPHIVALAPFVVGILIVGTEMRYIID